MGVRRGIPNGDGPHILLSTIPDSKGLKYDHVIYLDTCDHRGAYGSVDGKNMCMSLSRTKHNLTTLCEDSPSFASDPTDRFLLHQAFGCSNPRARHRSP